jgi:signal transduction histidine kinase
MLQDPNSAERYMVAIIQDITERKHAEEMVAKYTGQLVRANRELESKQAELEEFIYTVSHDLKAPIVSISGFAGLLYEKLSGTIDPDSLRHLNRINHNASVMDSLIGDLLELSRIGRMDDAEVTIDFDALVEEVIESFMVTARAKNIKLVKSTPLPQRHGREHRIRQLLANLVDNAIKYMPEDREGCVEIGFSKDADNSDERRQAFYVRDNGDGIPEEFHERIFAMFQRAPSSNGHTEGSGVGLAITKRIAEKHGGRIWVESKPGHGSTFYFTIPEKREGNAKNDSKPDLVEDTQAAKIGHTHRK